MNSNPDKINQSIYFPAKLHKKLEKLADKKNMCFSPFVVQVLEEALKKK